MKFPVLLGIPKTMIPYPLLWEGAVRTVGSHLGRIPNCSEVPPPPPPHPPGNGVQTKAGQCGRQEVPTGGIDAKSRQEGHQCSHHI